MPLEYIVCIIGGVGFLAIFIGLIIYIKKQRRAKKSKTL